MYMCSHLRTGPDTCLALGRVEAIAAEIRNESLGSTEHSHHPRQEKASLMPGFPCKILRTHRNSQDRGSERAKKIERNQAREAC